MGRIPKLAGLSTAHACQILFMNPVPCALQGGVGRIPELMVEGLVEQGGRIEYKANVREILVEGEGEEARAVGVRLADGRVYRCVWDVWCGWDGWGA